MTTTAAKTETTTSEGDARGENAHESERPEASAEAEAEHPGDIQDEKAAERLEEFADEVEEQLRAFAKLRTGLLWEVGKESGHERSRDGVPRERSKEAAKALQASMKEARREARWRRKGYTIWLTSASADYDFGRDVYVLDEESEYVAVRDGQPLRRVRIADEGVAEQVGRYRSGLHLSFRESGTLPGPMAEQERLTGGWTVERAIERDMIARSEGSGEEG